MKIFSYSILFLIFFISSCGNDTVDNDDPEDQFVSTITLIDASYPDLEEEIKDIMNKMQICTLIDTAITLPPCSADYFRVFKYRPEKEWNAGFIVEMVEGLYGAPVNQIVIIENYFGKYRIVNQYLGSLIEMRTKSNDYNDLLIRYTDPELGLITIRHEWQGEKYDVVDVEEINNHFIKAEMKDSINAVLLPAFSGGF